MKAYIKAYLHSSTIRQSIHSLIHPSTSIHPFIYTYVSLQKNHLARMGVIEIDPVQGGKALGLVIAAGLSTTFGAAIIFNSKLVMLTNKLFLAGALGFSSGVMVYVSFIEIFVKSHGAFESSGHSPANAYLFATLSFFGGILLMKIVDTIVHWVAGHADPLDMDISNNEETTKDEKPEVSCSEIELRAQVCDISKDR